MAITPAEVQKVARLARLQLANGEVASMSTQLSKILDYVGRLDELETTDVAPMAHPIETTNVLRPDVECPSLAREQALANAPATDGKYFLVPPIIER